MATTAQGELDDGTYRMRIEDRYKRNATNRKLIKIASIAQIVYICVRTFWKLMPFMLIGEQVEILDIVIFFSGVLNFAFYQYAFGYGRSQYEKSWAIKGYSIVSLLLVAECFVRFWLYHVLFGPQAADSEVAANYPHITKVIHFALSIGSETISLAVYRFLDVFEKGFEIAGLGAMCMGIFILKEYVTDMKKAREEAHERFEREKKTE